jgi:hypothetical protein
MSKREIELEVYQCDHEGENGERCTNEGNRDALQSCHVCHQDLCKEHCEITTVVFIGDGDLISNNLLRGSRLRFLYYFCDRHYQEFRNTVTDRYGEGEVIPNIGDGTYLA